MGFPPIRPRIGPPESSRSSTTHFLHQFLPQASRTAVIGRPRPLFAVGVCRGQTHAHSHDQFLPQASGNAKELIALPTSMENDIAASPPQLHPNGKYYIQIKEVGQIHGHICEVPPHCYRVRSAYLPLWKGSNIRVLMEHVEKVSYPVDGEGPLHDIDAR
jgi:hypothetical protein